MLEDAQRKISEVHEYARHVYQLFVAWITFFITVNFASMGWLAKEDTASQSTQSSSRLVAAVAVLFISQHVLGIIACVFIDRHLKRADGVIQSIEQEVRLRLPDRVCSIGPASSMPLQLYRQVLLLFATAMTCIASAWIVYYVIQA